VGFHRCNVAACSAEHTATSWERLSNGDCDLIFHHLDKSSPAIETIELFEVKLVPVAAPGFLKQPLDASLTPDDLRPYVQCVIRDTSKQPSDANHYLIEGCSRTRCTEALD
jgi:DNA-binding transcriptional LysR family regulator